MPNTPKDHDLRSAYPVPVSAADRVQWPPKTSHLDPHLRTVLELLRDQGGGATTDVVQRELHASVDWTSGVVDVLLTAARARGFVWSFRMTGRSRRHVLSKLGWSWLDYDHDDRFMAVDAGDGRLAADS